MDTTHIQAIQAVIPATRADIITTGTTTMMPTIQTNIITHTVLAITIIMVITTVTTVDITQIANELSDFHTVSKHTLNNTTMMDTFIKELTERRKNIHVKHPLMLPNNEIQRNGYPSTAHSSTSSDKTQTHKEKSFTRSFYSMCRKSTTNEILEKDWFTWIDFLFRQELYSNWLFPNFLFLTTTNNKKQKKMYEIFGSA